MPTGTTLEPVSSSLPGRDHLSRPPDHLFDCECVRDYIEIRVCPNGTRSRLEDSSSQSLSPQRSPTANAVRTTSFNDGVPGSSPGRSTTHGAVAQSVEHETSSQPSSRSPFSSLRMRLSLHGSSPGSNPGSPCGASVSANDRRFDPSLRLRGLPGARRSIHSSGPARDRDQRGGGRAGIA